MIVDRVRNFSANQLKFTNGLNLRKKVYFVSNLKPHGVNFVIYFTSKLIRVYTNNYGFKIVRLLKLYRDLRNEFISCL